MRGRCAKRKRVSDLDEDWPRWTKTGYRKDTAELGLLLFCFRELTNRKRASASDGYAGVSGPSGCGTFRDRRALPPGRGPGPGQSGAWRPLFGGCRARVPGGRRSASPGGFRFAGRFLAPPSPARPAGRLGGRVGWDRQPDPAALADHGEQNPHAVTLQQLEGGEQFCHHVCVRRLFRPHRRRLRANGTDLRAAFQSARAEGAFPVRRPHSDEPNERGGFFLRHGRPVSRARGSRKSRAREGWRLSGKAHPDYP